ncbi:hypothetical protein [Rubinisphaera sp.]|uniref:hypothetical protein n=1 Tax=Rubinisphaera sp. TaxID=2024857 RepID=UPI000C11DD59|nr:hypothetical protein [Rubinisphaera sp.]MBV12212.1 hypothetical protein [Rubinisphaera sp.]|tara:strand:- start:6784 stop:7233 length:450 start_codon:yes stop_codon:yes gene_type:complete
MILLIAVKMLKSLGRNSQGDCAMSSHNPPYKKISIHMDDDSCLFAHKISYPLNSACNSDFEVILSSVVKIIEDDPPPYRIIIQLTGTNKPSSIALDDLCAIARAFSDTGGQIFICNDRKTLNDDLEENLLYGNIRIVQNEEQAILHMKT